MRRVSVSLLLVLLVLASATAAHAAPPAKSPAFLIYDPSGRVKVELGIKDVVRSSALAYHSPSGAFVTFHLTKQGAVKYRDLTRGLAKVGAKLGRPAHLAVVFGGRLYARPAVDYRSDPNGLDAKSGVSVLTGSLAIAQQLADGIRGS